MRLLLLALILLPSGVIAWLAWDWFRVRRMTAQLREQPPQRVCLQVKLPREAERSNVKMTRFWGRLERLISHDPETLPTNDNVISAALVGTGSSAGQAPLVRFLLWVPPALVERVQMELVECYEGEAQVTELQAKDDPLTEWTTRQLEHLHWQRAQQEAGGAADDNPAG